MLARQTEGSVVCPSCGRLVGVRDERCYICGRWNPGLWGWAPALGKLGRDLGFTRIVVIGCVALYVLTLIRNPDGVRMDGLGILGPDGRETLLFGASGALPIAGFGRWWTVLSAAWLHGGLIHILFNMMWIRQMVPAVAELYGVGRMLLIYAISSATGFALTSFMFFAGLPGPLAGARLTLGASAPLFGLFGAVYLYGRRTGNRSITGQMVQFLMIMLVFGVVVSGVDNWAHLGGFAGGYLAARAFDPLRPEQQHHLLLGLLALLAMVLSIVASVLHGLALGWPATLL